VRAAQISAWGGALELVERPAPVAGEGEVLVRVDACGVGLTVLNCIRGDLGSDDANLPRIPGHEVVGVVEAVGAGVDRKLEGERVAAYFYLSCGTCRECLAGFEPLCARLGGYVGVDRDGGYGELCVLPAFNVLPLPALDPVTATTVPDAIATPVHVARRTSIRPGARVVVCGAGGGLGIHMVQVAKAYGGEVVALDVAPEKLAYLEHELGAVAVDSSDFGRIALPAAWDARADVVVDFVGARASLEWGVSVLAPNGTLVCTTTFRDRTFELSPRDLVLAQATVAGSRYASRSEVGIAAALVASERVRPVVGRRVGLDELESLHDDLRDGSLLGRGALVWGQT
jgi:D-arabinose 1-dehydrogenase-like Zn-dependent alcohol dehydrogenase